MGKQSFWQEKWQNNETMWKGEHVNDVLADFLPTLQEKFGILSPSEVLVPLCGDSPAVRMLYDAGYLVTGVDCVPEAIEALIQNSFSEKEFIVQDAVYTAPGLEFVRGDFFDLNKPERFSFIYDRAGYVALALDDRRRYAKTVTKSLRRGGVFLTRTAELVGTSWNDGPPFSVTFEEVKNAYPDLELVSHEFEDVVPTQSRFLDAGVTTIRHLTCVMQKP